MLTFLPPTLQTSSGNPYIGLYFQDPLAAGTPKEDQLLCWGLHPLACSQEVSGGTEGQR